MKEKIYRAFFETKYKADKDEIIKFKDGG